MELKVACDCGQKYKFDVEPAEGRMPFTVNCPVCGIDGTPAANELLAKDFNSLSVVPAAPIETAPMTVGGLRINRPASVAAPPPPLFANSAAPSPLPTSAPALGSRPGIPIRNLVSPGVKAGPIYNLWLGILGAFLGAAIGGGLVFGFYLWTGSKMPLMGTCIGLIAGIGARILARGGDATLGAIAATLSVFSSVCALYFSFQGYLSIGMIISIVVSGVIAFKSSTY